MLILNAGSYACRAKVQSVRPFGVFVALSGFRRNGMVHSSQVADEMSLTREDEDDMKVKTMEFYAPPGSEVITSVALVLNVLMQIESAPC